MNVKHFETCRVHTEKYYESKFAWIEVAKDFQGRRKVGLGEGADFVHHNNTSPLPPGFSDLATGLNFPQQILRLRFLNARNFLPIYRQIFLPCLLNFRMSLDKDFWRHCAFTAPSWDKLICHYITSFVSPDFFPRLAKSSVCGVYKKEKRIN